ncbi:MAG TPA: protein kinase, partial [Polyangiaceae bacterium]|nr:protein kinase [Polyangiaceae bacterium]
MFPQIFGKYVLECEIGAGGMARVYKATLRGAGGFEKRLVVKQIRAELASDAAFVQRFVAEAKTAVELSHPNIVPVYELGVEQGVYYIAMELCEGVTLFELLANGGPLDPVEGAYVGVEICRALDYAHRRAGIVHRDVTPRNVLVDEEGAVRLIDFGIAAPVSRGEASGPREVFGSPGHMPPEQLRGADLTPAADVFAVGALLIEVWTGTPPFRRKTSAESARALLEAPLRLSDRLEALADLIARCVALDAADRPQSADDLARPLREFLKTADLGDVARRLGERARRVRGGTQPSAANASAPDALPAATDMAAPSAGSGEPRTRTFAAREELTVWTRQVEPSASEPPHTLASDEASSGPHTRRLPEPAAERVGPGQPLSKGSRPRTVLALTLLFVALAVVLLVERNNRASSAAAPAPHPSSHVLRALPAEVAITSPAAIDSGLPSVVRAPPRPPNSGSSAVASTPAAGPASSDGIGTLRLTADPPAAVTIEGPGFRDTRSTPVRALSLKSGVYTITFRNETFGSPVATRVAVGSGATRSVH